MNNKHYFDKKKLGYILIFLIALCVISPLPYFLVKQHYSLVKQHSEKQHLQQLQQIVQAIQSGTLKPNRSGDITLPAHFARLTKNGHVYLSSDPTQSFIFFPEQIDILEVEWHSELPPNKQLPTEHKLQISGYVYSRVPMPNGSAVNVDDPAIEPIFAELPAKRVDWYYAVPMPD